MSNASWHKALALKWGEVSRIFSWVLVGVKCFQQKKIRRTEIAGKQQNFGVCIDWSPFWHGWISDLQQHNQQQGIKISKPSSRSSFWKRKRRELFSFTRDFFYELQCFSLEDHFVLVCLSVLDFIYAKSTFFSLNSSRFCSGDDDATFTHLLIRRTW